MSEDCYVNKQPQNEKKKIAGVHHWFDDVNQKYYGKVFYKKNFVYFSLVMLIINIHQNVSHPMRFHHVFLYTKRSLHFRFVLTQ